MLIYTIKIVSHYKGWGNYENGPDKWNFSIPHPYIYFFIVFSTHWICWWHFNSGWQCYCLLRLYACFMGFLFQGSSLANWIGLQVIITRKTGNFYFKLVFTPVLENIGVLVKILLILEYIYSAEQWFFSCYNGQFIAY